MTPDLDYIVADDHVRIAIRVEGPVDAPPLILAHPLGGAQRVWDAVAARLGSHFRLIRYDSRGHGDSDAPSGDYALDRLGQDVLSLMDVLHLDQAAFAGVSLGGMVGQWLGIEAPERVTRLVLLATAPWLGPRESWDERIAQVRGEGMGDLIEPTLERWFTVGFRERRPEAVEPVRAMLAATTPEGYAGCAAAIRDMDLRGDIGAIRTPTLVVGGRADPTATPEQTQALAEAIPGAERLMLEAAHLVCVEQADACARAMARFLGA